LDGDVPNESESESQSDEDETSDESSAHSSDTPAWLLTDPDKGFLFCRHSLNIVQEFDIITEEDANFEDGSLQPRNLTGREFHRVDNGSKVVEIFNENGSIKAVSTWNLFKEPDGKYMWQHVSDEKKSVEADEGEDEDDD
jgi:hypothetical protein